MNVNKHLKILKYIMYILLIISLFMGLLDKVKADTLQITASNVEYRFYNETFTAGAQCSPACVSNNANWYPTYLDISFKPNAYWGYPNYFYTFSVQLETYVGNSTLTAIALTDSSYNVIGTCESYTNSTGQITSLTATCYLTNTGLKNGKNILRLGLSGIRDGSNNFACVPRFNSTIYAVNNFYQSVERDYTNQINVISSNQSNINNSINSQGTTINNSIQDTNNTLKDSNIDSPNSTTSQWSNMNASNGTITNLLTLPITLLQAYVNGMNGTCSAFSLGTLFDTEIVLPCINISSLIGSALYSIIDVLFSGFMIYGIAKKLIKIFNDFTNMKSNQIDELYGGGA